MDGGLTTDALPWLIREGAVVGWVAAAAAALLGALAALAIRRALRIRRAGSRRRGLGAPSREPSAGPLTLRGVLEADAPAKRFDDGAPCAATLAVINDASTSDRAEGLRLRVGSDTVVIDGPADVVVGTHERTYPSVGALDPETVERLVAASDQFEADAADETGSTWSARSLAIGDRVIARGVVERVASRDEGADYRSTASRWVLAPEEGRDAVLLATATAPSERRRTRAIATAVAGACLGLGAVYVAGVLAYQTIPRGRDADAPTLDAATQIATASPFHRDRALSRLTSAWIGHEGPWDERWAAIAFALGGDRACSPALVELRGRITLDERVALAVRCERATAIGNELVMTGELERASELYAAHPSDDHDAIARAGWVHLMTGHRERAAEAARREAAHLPSYAVPWEEGSLRCVADALDARSGDDRARARLAEPPGGPPQVAPRCAFLHALVTDAEPEALAEPRFYGEEWLQQALLAARGRWPTRPSAVREWVPRSSFPPSDPRIELLYAGAVLDAALAHPPATPEGLEAALADEEDYRAAFRAVVPSAVYAAIAATRANTHSLFGHPDRARETLDAARAHRATVARYVEARLSSLERMRYTDERVLADALAQSHETAALVELRAGAPDAAVAHLDALDAVPEGERVSRALRAATTAPSDLAAMWRLIGDQLDQYPEAEGAVLSAASGDGGPLAARIGDSGYWFPHPMAPPGDDAGVSVTAVAARGLDDPAPVAAAIDAQDPVREVGLLPYAARHYSAPRQLADAADATRAADRLAHAQDAFADAAPDPFDAAVLALWIGL